MEKCEFIKLSKIGTNILGFLTPIEGNKDIPFDIKRVYYLYNVPSNIKRGLHAHKTLEQILICLNGTVDIKVSDGETEEVFQLNTPDIGLYIGPKIWREMVNFTHETVLLVLASKNYDEEDYIRDYHEFQEYIKNDKITF
ncbi:dTDP-4-dehydrorhamnose 3,5-epimerase-like enzyme [Anaerosolibacter carboniphilus]|uniref:dTDP-4-dehydrorhamnose 3,5-epimerase-like enzyme n=1 Tax=Anaerosolibacter carboniphilus TaxID=1417629 RepID=A0A841KSQ3_9FIRM|nr:FdtA/QdtA family cupin domain-containing protein [Anaerosolibacter carboniphilus]MBB6216423.1 dTDP-4-dehydrorhamnose 3,5-epimerase-like enzyme [Anaerosolibacter carboniphilus]